MALYVNAENVSYFDILGLSTFQKKLEKLLEIKILKQICIEYKHMIQ